MEKSKEEENMRNACVYLITFNKYQDDTSCGGREGGERLFTDANSLPVDE